MAKLAGKLSAAGGEYTITEIHHASIEIYNITRALTPGCRYPNIEAENCSRNMFVRQKVLRRHFISKSEGKRSVMALDNRTKGKKENNQVEGVLHHNLFICYVKQATMSNLFLVLFRK